MKFFKSIGGARLILVVVMLSCLVLGGHRSLVRARGNADAAAISLTAELDKAPAIAANVQTVVARNVPGATEKLAAAQSAYGHATALSDKVAAWETLTEEISDSLLSLGASDRALSPKDADYARGFATELAAQQAIISHMDYHALAAAYNSDVLGKFPANLLAKLTGVAPLPTLN